MSDNTAPEARIGSVLKRLEAGSKMNNSELGKSIPQGLKEFEPSPRSITPSITPPGRFQEISVRGGSLIVPNEMVNPAETYTFSNDYVQESIGQEIQEDLQAVPSHENPPERFSQPETKVQSPSKLRSYLDRHPKLSKAAAMAAGLTVAAAPQMASDSLNTPSAHAQEATAYSVPLLDGFPSRTFSETGKTVQGQFLDYWEQHGGLAQQGFPISEAAVEKGEDNQDYTTQYFERAVFQHHPKNAGTKYEVLLARLGADRYENLYNNNAPGQFKSTAPDAFTFKETGKTVGGDFLKYWKEHGGLEQQGFPISEQFKEKSPIDGKEYTVQYFERAVFELHPENPPPHNVLLSQLGRFKYEEVHGGNNQETKDRFVKEGNNWKMDIYTGNGISIKPISEARWNEFAPTLPYKYDLYVVKDPEEILKLAAQLGLTSTPQNIQDITGTALNGHELTIGQKWAYAQGDGFKQAPTIISIYPGMKELISKENVRSTIASYSTFSLFNSFEDAKKDILKYEELIKANLQVEFK